MTDSGSANSTLLCAKSNAQPIICSQWIYLHLNPNPIQWLCPDILAEIFTFCLLDIQPWGYHNISSREAPLQLCSVCSSWRSLAISTPRLWQTLQLHSIYHEMFKRSVDRKSITSGLRTWLDRSKPLPLSIRAFFCRVYPKSDQATKCRLIFEVLLQEVSRWERFEFSDDYEIASSYFGLQQRSASDIPKSLIQVDRIPFTAASRLKRMCLPSLPDLTSVSATPWDQLVELSIWKAQRISTVVEVIRRCPRLESLLLAFLRPERGDDPLTFKHDTLWRLHLYLSGWINGVTDYLTLPALTSLFLRSPPLLYDDLGSRLVDFFTRSNCELQELELDCSALGTEALLQCLSHRSCQTLTRLVIKADYDYRYPQPMIDTELLALLTYSDVDDDVPLCPKLVHLELDRYRANRSFPGLLGRMIHSRCFGRAQDAQLRSLRLCDTYYPISREDNELLQFAESNGGLELMYDSE